MDQLNGYPSDGSPSANDKDLEIPQSLSGQPDLALQIDSAVCDRARATVWIVYWYLDAYIGIVPSEGTWGPPRKAYINRQGAVDHANRLVQEFRARYPAPLPQVDEQIAATRQFRPRFVVSVQEVPLVIIEIED